MSARRRQRAHRPSDGVPWWAPDDSHRALVGSADLAGQGRVHGRAAAGARAGRAGRGDRDLRGADRRDPRGQPADRPVRRGRDDRAADDRPDRVPDHLHGDEDHRPDESSDRAGPRRAVRVAPVGRPRAQGPHEGGLHPDRRRLDGLHLGAGRRLPRERDDPARHPVRTRDLRPGLQPRSAVLLRDRRAVGRRAADGRMVELQQVLAARRVAGGGPGHQLRDPTRAVGGRADPAGRDDEPERDRREPGAAGSPTGTSSASRSGR